MKNYILLFITIISVFSFNCFAQKTKVSLADKKMESTQITSRTLSKKIPNPVRTVKSYHVEESINMKFGGYTITYNVSDPSLINTNDLGPNNTRVVTPRFTKERQPHDYQTKTITDTVKSTLSPYNLGVTDPSKDSSKDSTKDSTKDSSKDSSKKHDNYAYIVMIKTYERVAEKGYKSVDLFQKLGNAYYYNAEMDKAAKWYGKLFAMTSDLKPEYYYRYANSLKAIGQNDKANQMLGKFNQLSGNNTR
jgi:tetratricopeptide (TPR) repeat protein